MLGVVKYFNKYTENNKKFLYNDDYDEVKNYFRQYGISHKTIDCEVMDLSDEIAYAIHDLEDALKLRYFTIDELLYEFSISEDFKSVTEIFEGIINRARQFAEKAQAYKTSEEYAMLFRKELTSLLMTEFILDIGLINGKLGHKNLALLSKGLKKLTFEAIKRQPDIIEYEQLGKHILRKLFALYSDDQFNKNLVLLPANYRFIDAKNRMILDYIGGMTDSYAFSQYEKYHGKLQEKGFYQADRVIS